MRRVALLAGLALLLGPAAVSVHAGHTGGSSASCFAIAPFEECEMDSQVDIGTSGGAAFPSVTVCAGTEPDPDHCHPFPFDQLLRGAGYTGYLEIAFTPQSSGGPSGYFDCGPYVAGVQGDEIESTGVGSCTYNGDKLDGVYDVSVTATPDASDDVPGVSGGGVGAYQVYVYE